MKIPKKDGTTNHKDYSKRGWEDITCDKCGKSCLDSLGMNFEFAEIEAMWGYGSSKDTTRHRAEVCEPCYDAMGIKAQVTEYM